MEIVSLQELFIVPDAFKQVCLATNSLETILNASETCTRAHAILFPTSQNCSFEEQVAAYIVSNPTIISSLGNKMYSLAKDKPKVYHKLTNNLLILFQTEYGLRARNSYQMIETYLKDGANPNYIKNSYPTLHIACCDGNYEVAKLLLKYGAKINGTDNAFGTTALHYAAKRNLYIYDKDRASVIGPLEQENQLKILRLLISHGVDINKKNKKGNTALYEACLADNYEAAKFLIEKGAQCTNDCFNHANNQIKFLLLYSFPQQIEAGIASAFLIFTTLLHCSSIIKG